MAERGFLTCVSGLRGKLQAPTMTRFMAETFSDWTEHHIRAGERYPEACALLQELDQELHRYHSAEWHVDVPHVIEALAHALAALSGRVTQTAKDLLNVHDVRGALQWPSTAANRIYTVLLKSNMLKDQSQRTACPPIVGRIQGIIHELYKQGILIGVQGQDWDDERDEDVSEVHTNAGM